MVLKKMDAGEDVFRILQADHSEDCVGEEIPCIEQEDDDSRNLLNYSHDIGTNIDDDASLLTTRRGRKLRRNKNEAYPKNDVYVPRVLDEILPPLRDSTTEQVLATPLSSFDLDPPNLSLSPLKVDNGHHHTVAMVQDSIPIFHSHVDVQIAAEVLLELSTPIIHDSCKEFDDKACSPSSHEQIDDSSHKTLNDSSTIQNHCTAV